MRGPSSSPSSRRRAATTDYVKVVIVVSVLIAGVVTVERLQYLQAVLDGFNCCAGGDVPLRHAHRSKPERQRLMESTATRMEPSADTCWHGAPESTTRHNSSQGAASTSEVLPPPSVGCGTLSRKWTQKSVRSPLARRIEAQQTNCSLSVATYHMDNAFGFGSHLHVWSQAMCNAMEAGRRLQTYNPEWLWMDQAYCGTDMASKSPLLCYFPLAEDRCRPETSLAKERRILAPVSSVNVTDPKNARLRCSLVRQQGQLTAFRAASMEYIFQKLSPLVVQEARRQAGLLFGPSGTAPDNMITVHMRWGDKFWEMDLPHEDEYVAAVSRLSRRLPGGPDGSTHVYLATEDPSAADAFLRAAPDNWTVYIDRTIAELNDYRPQKGNRASWAAKNSRGRAGLVALGSLLVALEARFFVLTTQSNWSRLLDQIRRVIIDHQCGNCTEAIDLRPGEW